MTVQTMQDLFRRAEDWASDMFDAMPDDVQRDPEAVDTTIRALGISSGFADTPLEVATRKAVRRSYQLQDGQVAS